MTGHGQVAKAATILVVVVLHNSAQHVPGLIETLKDWRLMSRLLLVDTYSSDLPEVENAVSAADVPSVTLVKLARNAGYGGAINWAVDALVGDEEYLLFLNPDTTLSVEALGCLHQRLASDERLAVVAPVTRRLNGRPLLRRPTRLLNAAAEFLPRGVVAKFHFLARWAVMQEAEADVAWAEGSILLVRTAPFRSIGGFDRDFFLYSEDEDLCRRLWSSGWGVRQVDCGSSMDHERGGSSVSTHGAIRAVYTSSCCYFLKKWYGGAAAAVYTVAFAVSAGLRRAIGRQYEVDVGLALRRMWAITVHNRIPADLPLVISLGNNAPSRKS